jgi:hypothetical protein
MALNNSKTLLIAVVAVLLTFFGNGIISYVTSNRVADKVVTEDHIRIENINKDIEDINSNLKDIDFKITKLNDDKLDKEAFGIMVIDLQGQIESAKQMITAMEKQNKVDYGRFQQKYDDLERQFQENIEKYKLNKQNQITSGGVVR